MKLLVVRAAMQHLLLGVLLLACLLGSEAPKTYAMPRPGPPCAHPIDFLPECVPSSHVSQAVQQIVPSTTACCRGQKKEFLVNTFRKHIVRATAAATIVLAGFAAELSVPALRSLAVQYNVSTSLVRDIQADFGSTTVQAADNQQRAYARPRRVARTVYRPE
jgi:hypothetical protein